ncbi:hypothetical protein OHA74_31915 [Streptomyces phaeochromogenes]|uniref:hypothetical protein n=1 Tax=Streptomyces phaeochromogenes TaxID=1923 RepID=UPI002E2BEFF6|nr:hypothetical protein [Streptomyces phaeochromogenes]
MVVNHQSASQLVAGSLSAVHPKGSAIPSRPGRIYEFHITTVHDCRNDQVTGWELAFQASRRLQSAQLRFKKSRAIWSTPMSDHEHLPESPEDAHRTTDQPRISVIAATIVAVTSSAAAVTILILAPDESGAAAAGAVATAGLTLAGRLGSQSR